MPSDGTHREPSLSQIPLEGEERGGGRGEERGGEDRGERREGEIEEERGQRVKRVRKGVKRREEGGSMSEHLATLVALLVLLSLRLTLFPSTTSVQNAFSSREDALKK